MKTEKAKRSHIVKQNSKNNDSSDLLIDQTQIKGKLTHSQNVINKKASSRVKTGTYTGSVSATALADPDAVIRSQGPRCFVELSGSSKLGEGGENDDFI